MNEDNVDLEPCPFCSEQPENNHVWAQKYMDWIKVQVAVCKTKGCPMENLNVCATGWNTRKMAVSSPL